MLGLGLRSTQGPGLSSSATPPSIVTELIGEDFNGSYTNDLLSINPFSSTTTVKQTSLPANWAQSFDAVIGTSNPLVANDVTSVGVWGERTVGGIVKNLYPLGWHSDHNSTTSTLTGPSGSPTSRTDDSVATTTDTTKRVLYTEGSGADSGMTVNSDRVFLLRSPGVNFSTSMTSTSNPVRLELQAHGYGDLIGDLEIWIDNASTSNSTSAVKLFTFQSSSFTQLSESDSYNKISFRISTIDHPTLGSIDVRTTNDTFYFYIVHLPPESPGQYYWKSDLAIDNFYVDEMSH